MATFEVKSSTKGRVNCKVSIELPDVDEYTEQEGVDAIQATLDYLSGRAVDEWLKLAGSEKIMEWEDLAIR